MKFGYYYLHSENKKLIFKPRIVVETDPGYFNSPYVLRVWEISNKEDYNKMIEQAKKLSYTGIE